MIIKSLTRRSNNFSQPVRYILEKNQDKKLCLQILHNIDCNSTDTDEVIKAFKDNDKFRVKNKRSTVSMYHEILSFSDLDKNAILKNPIIMEDMARQYLQMRTDGIGMAYPHYDTAHPHVHILLSANQKESTKSIRISKSEFSKIKRQLEKYLSRTYPELSNSINTKHLFKGRKEIYR